MMDTPGLRPYNYPQNLATYDPLQQNGDAYNKRLTNESETLFSKNGPPKLEVYEARDSNGNSWHQTIDSAESLNKYLKTIGRKQISRIFYIPRCGSMSPLKVTEEMIRRLLNHFEIFTGFLDLLFEFGGKDRRSYGMTTFRESGHISLDFWELCYGLNFVERHGRERQSDPWSIRRTGVYQKHNSQTQENTWCLLHPSDEVRGRLKSTYGSLQSGLGREPLREAARFHLLFASHATEGWGLYIAYLEEAFVKMGDKALMYEVESDKSGLVITFVDSQTIHNLEEKVSIVLSTLQSNCEVLSSLQKKLKPYWNIDGNFTPDANARSHIFKDPLSFYLAQHREKMKNVTLLLGRIRGISGLFHRIHEFGNLKLLENLLQEHRDEMKCISELQHREAQERHQEAEKRCQEAEQTASLAQKSLEEAEIMRRITIAGAIFYVPTTLVASLLGMGYLHVHVNSRPHLTLDGEMWAFLAAAVVLTITTAVYFHFWGRRRLAVRDLENNISPFVGRP